MPGIIKVILVITNAIVVINDVIIENYITPLLHCDTKVHVKLLNALYADVHIHTTCTLAHGHTTIVVVEAILELDKHSNLEQQATYSTLEVHPIVCASHLKKWSILFNNI